MFTMPLYLIAGAIGALIPLVLHLFQKKRVVQQSFPTLRFLKMAEQHASRRIRLENLLLWALRTVIMLLLGAAFAMPILRARGLDFLGAARRDVAVVIDASYSMKYRVGRQRVWDNAIEAAADIINGLGPNDRISLFLAREYPVALIAEPVGDLERAAARLDGLDPAYDTSCLSAVLVAAHDALLQVPGRREREIFILTDNQALPWGGFGEHSDGLPGRWNPEEADAGTAIFVAMLGAKSPVNAAPLDLRLLSPVMSAGAPAQLLARIGGSGGIVETTASLHIDDREIARRPVQLDGAESAPAKFVVPPLPAGVHAARIETPDDNLPVDNVFYFLLRVRDALPVLCVGSERDTVFLRAALEAGMGGREPRRIDPEQLGGETALADYSCIFLVNALPLPGGVIAALEKYVSDGGLLAFFPGSRATVGDYRAWDCLPATPSGIDSPPSSERSRVLTWDRPQHPLLEPMRDSLAAPRLSINRSLVWENAFPDKRWLVSAGAEHPFLLQRDYGRGGVLMFSVGADRAWSNFPLSPFYLPMIMQIVDYSAGVGAREPFAWSGDSVELDAELPGAGPGMRLLDPEGGAVSIRSVIRPGGSVAQVAALEKPGIYMTICAESGSASPALAVNFPRRESDLTPIGFKQVSALLGIPNVNVSTDRESLRNAIRDHRVGRTFGEHLLLLALLLVGLEFYYANMLSRSKPELSAMLGVTSSGKMNGAGDGRSQA